MLERAISNLVENALKYSPHDRPVEVAVTGRRLEVRDDGRGIPELDLPHVFDRFYRSVEARTEPGSGLGLAIVKQTVERQRGHGLGDESGFGWRSRRLLEPPARTRRGRGNRDRLGCLAPVRTGERAASTMPGTMKSHGIGPRGILSALAKTGAIAT